MIHNQCSYSKSIGVSYTKVEGQCPPPYSKSRGTNAVIVTMDMMKPTVASTKHVTTCMHLHKCMNCVLQVCILNNRIQVHLGGERPTGNNIYVIRLMS